jgi:predicted Zn-ribbon and HTH transcriptional regulator
VLNELSLWSEISSEHPIFIKTVAELTNKNLTNELIEKLNHINVTFENIKKKTKELENLMPFTYMNYGYVVQVRMLIDRFLKEDMFVLTTLDEVKEVGQEDKVWQTLLEHITEEQRFMYETFSKIKRQLG